MPYSTITINTPPPYLTLSSSEHLPTVLTVAGSDSSGGAGIEADIKTITAHRCYAQTCITALTVQTPVSVFDVQLTPKKIVSGILEANLRDMKCDVIKTGMLTMDAIAALNDRITAIPVSERPLLVVDPVLVATSGSPLAGDELVAEIKEKITPFATILTPNIPESFKLIGEERAIDSLDTLYKLAMDVREACNCSNVLIKGGHIPWSGQLEGDNQRYITDVLLLGDSDKFIVYKGHYSETTHTHGTGCTLGSAIASNLARGYSLAQAVYGGIEYVQNAVSVGCEVTKDSVKENGPINHVYAVEIPLEKMLTDECFSATEVIPPKPNSVIPKEMPLMKKSFSQYLQNHPKVKPHWDSYIKHDFVRQIADGTLAKEKFQYFVEQDYSYLVDYGRVHCIVASKIPTLDDMEKELMMVAGVRTEMDNHKKRLREEFGVKDDSYFEQITKGPALKAYSRYFNDVALRGNWQELIAALTPCLMGYGYALYHVEDNITTTDPVYLDWLAVYSSKEYRHHIAEGERLMQHVLQTYPLESLDTLINIYADVCELETKFWDAALNYTKN
ncbi:similar to Saccharomyces cerevisiae YOL055C THI20 Multifunctional protein with hydroxymethylpyrimidine phosphate (HMP-P) kinase and thiaminase activities [Maudiozyma saulgeensis]|uniref:Similar to Saccharomyces cerevisiae YOL055C THI20 Multifunctional protein with hydroxymethylpyrimidine phosphate (HMP-P) kinase and thiaminase activities n=1 Tax=Maudiozyma saulgeensis TaxID=1789683 RepID=A0A1X7RB69_9SACH|nr:similar to Saccharomyces cerevisiae YOL055C THI20 Multifunctional protein with hydroxymethylpyrimidine phosphate (HMP-P) kinase and thiaminase activities [Kazachstania saulgeensis]